MMLYEVSAKHSEQGTQILSRDVSRHSAGGISQENVIREFIHTSGATSSRP